MNVPKIIGACVVLASASSLPAQIPVNHPPYNAGGGASDLEFRPPNDIPQWQRLADDIGVATSADVVSVNWWGFYRDDNPSANEQFQIRLYANEESVSLPGELLYEAVVSDPQRDATGRLILISGTPREFQFHSRLPTLMHLDADVPYWLEITQVDNPAQWYFAEFGTNHLGVLASSNSLTPEWHATTTGGDLAFQLIVPEPTTAMLLLGAAIAKRRIPFSSRMFRNPPKAIPP